MCKQVQDPAFIMKDGKEGLAGKSCQKGKIQMPSETGRIEFCLGEPEDDGKTTKL